MASPNTLKLRSQIQSGSRFARVLISHSYSDKRHPIPSLATNSVIECRDATYIVQLEGNIRHLHGKAYSRRDAIRIHGKAKIKAMLY